MPSTNLEKIYTSPYRSFNFQQLFFYDIFLRNAYFASYRLSKYTTVNQFLVILYFSGVRGVERYEHASLAASLGKNINTKKTII